MLELHELQGCCLQARTPNHCSLARSYMSPEVFTRYDVSPALDIYSFGIIGEPGSYVCKVTAVPMQAAQPIACYAVLAPCRPLALAHAP